MKKTRIAVLVLAVALLLSACGGVKSELITMEEYNSLKEGMSYKEVVDIIGSEGEEVSSNNIAGYSTVAYSWEGHGSVGANANVMFQNDKLVSKAQAGLK